MKKILAIIAVFAVVMSLAGCEQLESVGGYVKEKLNIEEKAVETEAPEQETVQEVTNDYSIGIIDFDTWNPLVTQSATMREAMELVYEPLFRIDEHMEPQPVLVKDYSISADGKTLEITMNTDISWHDGSRLSAYDVAYTIKFIKSGITNYTANLKDMADYRATSDSTLRMVLSRSVPDFVSLLTFPIVKYQTNMQVDPGYSPVGTGPYYFSGKTETDNYRLSAFDGYHGGRPAIDTVNIKRIPDDKKLRSMFETSEIDVITSEMVDLTEYMPRGSVATHDYISNRLTFVGFNFYSQALWGTQTRAAIGKLIDKDAIVNSVIYSRGVASDIAINPQSCWYYDTKQRFRSEEEMAKEKLSNDGWKINDDGIMAREIGGKKQTLELTLLVNSDSKQKKVIADRIKSDLDKIGVKVKIDAQPYEAYMQKINSRSFDMFVGEIEIEPNQDLTPMVGEGNYFTYHNDEVTTLIAQIGLTQDKTEKSLLFTKLAEKIKEDAPFIPLYYSKESVLTSAKIKSGVLPTVSNYYNNANIWSVK